MIIIFHYSVFCILILCFSNSQSLLWFTRLIFGFLCSFGKVQTACLLQDFWSFLHILFWELRHCFLAFLLSLIAFWSIYPSLIFCPSRIVFTFRQARVFAHILQLLTHICSTSLSANFPSFSFSTFTFATTLTQEQILFLELCSYPLLCCEVLLQVNIFYLQDVWSFQEPHWDLFQWIWEMLMHFRFCSFLWRWLLHHWQFPLSTFRSSFSISSSHFPKILSFSYFLFLCLAILSMFHRVQLRFLSYL